MKKAILALMLGIAAALSAQPLPYQNPDLSPEERAADLCSRLTLEEKASLMMNSSAAVERLGIPACDWWSEILHGVGRNGLATVFPSCIGMAASFDDDLIEEVFTAASDEARAKNTLARREGNPKKYAGLSFWTPNVNIFRDPRWGRGQETYGEDPYMTGRMGSRAVRGLQGDPSAKYLKLLACAKHYAVHSGPEKSRHHFNVEDLPARDLRETYLPAFKVLVQDAGVREVMCAYQRFEGAPCCGSDRLLQSILRDEWGYDGMVVSDCGAINDFVPGRHGVVDDAPAASALGVRAGTDVECGSVYRNLPEAVRRGDVSEDDIDVSVRRLLAERFRVGEFDPDELVGWTSIPMSVVSSDEHRALARRMGREQMVLLKNNGILPLSPDRMGRVMVMGPNAADSVMPWGIYYGTPAHTVTMLEGIEARAGKVAYDRACGYTDMGADGRTTDDVAKAAKGYDTVIFIGGISPTLEKEEAKVNVPGFEGGDRTSIELPQVQRDILAALHRAGKRIVLVNCSGSAVALTPEDGFCDAIVQAWYPGEQGGHALADVIFGEYNPSGKLPVTFYTDDSQLPPFEEYRMAGRTYRFMLNEPLYPFGYGLSYTTFGYGKPRFRNGNIAVDVTNTGSREGTEIVQLYVSRPDDAEGPHKTLRGYKRVTLQPGETRTVEIDVPLSTFEWWDAATESMRVLPGDYRIHVGSSSADRDLRTLKVTLK